MANHVYTNQTIKHSDPAEIQKLYDLLDRWSDSDDYGLVSYLMDKEYKKEDVDRNVMAEAIGPKWMTIDDMYSDEEEIVLMTTTAWGQPDEMWSNLEDKGFAIQANYEDEMPNFFGTYSTDEGHDYVDTPQMYEAIEETAENFQSDIKETGDYNSAMYEECVDAAIKAVEEPVNDFNRETIERLVENYLEFHEHYIEIK